MPITFPTDTAPISAALLPGSSVGLSWHNNNRKRLKKFALQYMGESSKAVVTLRSQGEADTSIGAVQDSRAGFTEMRVRLPVLHQYYEYSGDADVLARIKALSLAWVRKNIPTGKPIDETNFEGLIRVLTARFADFSGGEQTEITAWLNALKTTKEAWGFTPLTGEGQLEHGNHNTHHYKILFLLYRALGLSSSETSLISTLSNFAARNFPYGNSTITVPTDMPRAAVSLGESIDYIRRDALHYQVYNLEPWLEIAILAGGTVFESVVDNAYNFLFDKVFNPSTKHYEFAATNDPFDAARWNASHSEYLQPNALFLPDKITRVVFSYQYYKSLTNPTFGLDSRAIATAYHSRFLNSHWYYYFRWVFGGGFG
jgi:hypothetical protein